MQFARSLIASFLPSRQRRRWGLEGSALLQRAAFCGAILQLTAFSYMAWTRFVVDLRAAAPEDPLSWVLLAIREIVPDPFALAAALLAIEGLLRALVVACIGEIYPSLPFVLLARLGEGPEPRPERPDRDSRHIFTLHSRREDRVEQMGNMLVVATARQKPEWLDAAVCFAGLYYKAGGPHPGQHGLPYVYVLRPWPDGIVIRKTQYYDGPGFSFTPRKNRAS